MKKIIVFMSILVILPHIISADTVNLSDSKIVQYSGAAENEYLGVSESSAGDVNGDGYEDIIIGAPGANSNKGGAYLILGSSSILTSLSTANADVSYIGETSGDAAGYTVASAGDVNNDGYDDFLIGASAANSNTGAAYVIAGSSTIGSTSSVSLANANLKLTGESIDDYAGWSLASAGDINNDGYSDVIIGAYGEDDGADNAGAAYLVYGNSGIFTNPILGLNEAGIAKFTGYGEGEYSGYAVSGVGSVDGDVYDDFIIGGYRSDYNGYTNNGVTYLIKGQSSAFTNTYQLEFNDGEFTGADSGTWTGRTLAAAGDVNYDGYDDFLIGAPEEDTLASNDGAVYLVFGSDVLGDTTLSSGSSVVKFSAGVEGEYAGASISSAGDVNNDGYDDVIIGATRNDDQATNAGAAYLIYGNAEISGDISLASTSSVRIKFTGEASENYAGQSVAYGDFNNDNFSDLLIGAYGNNDGGLPNTGAAYLNYIFVDSDGDGLAGDSGLLDGIDTNDNDYDNDGSEIGTDCNDADDSIYPGAPEIQDSVDNDCDGDIDETTTAEDTDGDGEVDNVPNPDYDEIDPGDPDVDIDSIISSVVGAKNGRIKVTYLDTSVYLYTIFDITDSKKTKVKQYRDTGYYVVLHPRGKKLAIVNIFSAEVLKRKKLAAKAKYPTNSLKIMQLRKKYYAVVTSKNKKNKVRIVAAKININKLQFAKKKISATTNNSKVKVTKTSKKKNNLLLKNSKGKKLVKYLFTKKNKLKVVE